MRGPLALSVAGVAAGVQPADKFVSTADDHMRSAYTWGRDWDRYVTEHGGRNILNDEEIREYTSKGWRPQNYNEQQDLSTVFVALLATDLAKNKINEPTAGACLNVLKPAIENTFFPYTPNADPTAEAKQWKDLEPMVKAMKITYDGLTISFLRGLEPFDVCTDADRKELAVMTRDYAKSTRAGGTASKMVIPVGEMDRLRDAHSVEGKDVPTPYGDDIIPFTLSALDMTAITVWMMRDRITDPDTCREVTYQFDNERKRGHTLATAEFGARLTKAIRRKLAPFDKCDKEPTDNVDSSGNFKTLPNSVMANTFDSEGYKFYKENVYGKDLSAEEYEKYHRRTDDFWIPKGSQWKALNRPTLMALIADYYKSAPHQVRSIYHPDEPINSAGQSLPASDKTWEKGSDAGRDILIAGRPVSIEEQFYGAGPKGGGRHQPDGAPADPYTILGYKYQGTDMTRGDFAPYATFDEIKKKHGADEGLEGNLVLVIIFWVIIVAICVLAAIIIWKVTGGGKKDKGGDEAAADGESGAESAENV